MSKFKVGDTVKIKYNSVNDEIPAGYICVITEVGNHADFVWIKDATGFEDYVESRQLEKTEESPKKFDNDKPRLDLIRPEFTMGMGEALAYGAKKYSEPVGETPNYLKGDGFNYSRIIGSLERHIQQFKMGIDKDDESGLSHLKHAAVNLMFLLAYEESEHGIDDRVILEK